MMKIVHYDSTKRKEWDAFVVSNSLAWSGHLSGIFELEKETSHGKNHSLIGVNDQNRIACVLPLFETSHAELRILKIRQLTTGTHLRSGPLFDPKLSHRQRKDVLHVLMDNITSLARHVNVDRVIMAYPNIVGEETSLSYYGYFPPKHFGFNEQNVVTMIIDLSADTDVLFSRLEHACRKHIRKYHEEGKYGKEGARFHQILDRTEWLECYDLNVQTLSELSYTRKAMEIVWDQFVAKGFARVTAITFEGRVISVTVVTGLGKSCYPWIGFNSKPHIPGADDYLMWETMLLCKRDGFRFFDVGTMEFSSDKQRNIGRFKEKFNGTPVYGLSGTLDLKPGKKAMIELVRATWQRFIKHRNPR